MYGRPTLKWSKSGTHARRSARMGTGLTRGLGLATTSGV
jgi:hypothetical protein